MPVSTWGGEMLQHGKKSRLITYEHTFPDHAANSMNGEISRGIVVVKEEL